MSYLSRILGLVAVGVVAMFAGPAGAAPLATSNSAISQSDDSLTLVRDGCGYGMRWSNRRGGCVPDDGYGPGPGYGPSPPPPAYGYGPPPPPAYVDPGAAIVNGIIGGVFGAPPPPVCPPGTRWSNRAGGCVYF